MPAYSQAHADARDQFYQAYGCAMMVWSAVEEMLFEWFRRHRLRPSYGTSHILFGPLFHR
jgi:hypothetical protein